VVVVSISWACMIDSRRLKSEFRGRVVLDAVRT
jgi:hypothetical protein